MKKGYLKKKYQTPSVTMTYSVYWKWKHEKVWHHTYSYRDYNIALKYALQFAKKIYHMAYGNIRKQVKIVRKYKGKTKVIKQYNY